MNGLIFCLIISTILTNIENKSNFPKYLMIFLISALSTKYIFGDWDNGYKYTSKDIYYFVSLMITSFFGTQIKLT